jgi:hypothetical protein
MQGRGLREARAESPAASSGSGVFESGQKGDRPKFASAAKLRLSPFCRLSHDWTKGCSRKQNGGGLLLSIRPTFVQRYMGRGLGSRSGFDILFGAGRARYAACERTGGAFSPQQRLYFWPEPQGHGALRGIFGFSAGADWVCFALAVSALWREETKPSRTR